MSKGLIHFLPTWSGSILCRSRTGDFTRWSSTIRRVTCKKCKAKYKKHNEQTKETQSHS